LFFVTLIFYRTYYPNKYSAEEAIMRQNLINHAIDEIGKYGRYEYTLVPANVGRRLLVFSGGQLLYTTHLEGTQKVARLLPAILAQVA